MVFSTFKLTVYLFESGYNREKNVNANETRQKVINAKAKILNFS